METAKIFKVIYSDVSEEMKNMVLDTALYEMGQETSFKMLTESYSDGLSEMITDYVDLVAHNAVSEEDLNEALEQVLEAVDTDTINLVAESFIDREVRRALFEREETINELFGFGKKSEERTKAEGMLKASKASLAKAQAGAASELKGIKAMKQRTSSPIGLSGIRQHQAAMNAEAQVNKDLGAHKSEVAGAQAKLDAVKAKERKEAIDKVKGAAKSVWNKFTGAVKSGVEAAKNKATGMKDSTVKAAKAGVEKVKTGVETAKSKVSDAAKSAVAKGAGAVAGAATKVADAANRVQAKAESAKGTPKISDKAQTITKSKKDLLAQQKIYQDNLKDTGLSKKQLAYQQKALDKVNAQLAALKEEALAEVTSMLSSSNISESAFEEIMEKINSLVQKPEAKEIVGKKHREKYEKLLDMMQKKGNYSKEVQAEAQSEGTKAEKCGQ